jgi:3-deoxy-7-phosphoheptulonate synthase
MNESPAEALLFNVRVVGTEVLPSPELVKREIPAPHEAVATVAAARRTVQAILERTDPRLFVVVGPCSVHDTVAAVDYARRLHALAREVADVLFIVMRVYFEKPRTTVGWKGLINDPDLDDSFDIERGLRIARRLLIEINAMGLACGTEALDPITPQYLGDLIAWSAIGARTTESQTHREMASGLSTPVGFKNGTDGSLTVALNAMLSAAQPHAFLGVDPEGRVAIIRTAGNPYGHIILRGGPAPNYDSVGVSEAEEALAANGLPKRIVIDCSHANSKKNPARQPLVLRHVLRQVLEGDTSIVGVMLESNLHEGAQPIPEDRSQLRYGVSITDACLGWEDTEAALRQAAGALREKAHRSR